MGTEGMKASLVSREVIADSIELVARGHLFDALVALVGCDKTIPGAAMALARLDIPGVDALRRLDRARPLARQRDVTIQDVFEAIGAHAAGKHDRRRPARARGRRLPRAPAPAAASSPPTRWPCAFEFLGISPIGSSDGPGDATATKDDGRRRVGALVMDVLARRRARRARIVTRESLENAIAVGRGDRRLDQRASCTCSRSRARSASSSTIDDFDAHRARDAAARRPEAGRPLRRHRPLRGRRRRRSSRKRLDEAGLPARRRASRSTGQTIGEEADARRRDRRARRSSVPLDDAAQADAAASRSCAATSRPRAASSSSPATSARLHRGPARVFDSRGGRFAAVKAGEIERRRRRRDPLRGPARRARACARCSHVTARDRRRGARRTRSR